MPQDLLGGDLSLWQLRYGTGRTAEVWGLTDRPGVVVAHRITMADPPPEALLAVELAAGLPICPGACMRPGEENTTVLQVDGADLPAVRDWYTERLPAYGWRPGSAADTYETPARRFA